jgi:hypothetical protein
MRTTLDIEEDVLFAVKDLARRQNKTAGEVISDLARRALTRAPTGTEAREPDAFYGFRPLPRRGGVVSNELINRLREDDVY